MCIAVIAKLAYSILFITGLKFWKSRRKAFVVPISIQKTRKRKRQSEAVSLDSDSDDLTPKKVRDDTTIKITQIESKVNNERGDKRFFTSE